MSKPKTMGVSCSFCSKDQTEVKCMVACSAAAICNECVDVCNHVIFEKKLEEIVPHFQISFNVPSRARRKSGAKL